MYSDSKDLESSQKSFQPDYLAGFSEKELDELERKYHRSRADLEKMLAVSHRIIWLYRSGNWGAQLVTMLYTWFQITTGNAAINASVHAVKADTDVPETVAYSISVPIALIGMTMYLFTFSPRKEAVRSALDYLCRAPLKERIKDAWFIAQHDKTQAAKTVLQFGANQTVVQLVNATMGMSEVIGVAPYLLLAPTPVNGLLVGGFLYFAMRYLEFYVTPDYYRHLKEFWLSKEYPSVFSLMKEGKIAQPLRALEQGAASTGLRMLVLYFLAESSRKTLGWWPNSFFLAFLTAVHSVIVFYPYAYKRFLAKNVAIDAHLRKRFENEFKNFLSRYDFSDPEAAVRKMRTIMREEDEQQIIKQQGYRFLRKPEIVVPVLYDTVMGALLGFTTIAKMFAIESPVITAFSTLAGGALLGGLALRAEYRTALDAQVDAHNKQQEQKSVAQIPQQNAPDTCAVTTLRVVANTINVVTALATAMMTVGAVSSLVGDVPGAIIAVGIIAVQRALNLVLFNGPKVYDALAAALLPAAKTNVAKQGFFGNSPAAVPQENTARSWFCWRRANA